MFLSLTNFMQAKESDKLTALLLVKRIRQIYQKIA